MIEEAKNFSDVLYQLQKRPELYLGRGGKNITLLSTYLNGFTHARMIYKVSDTLAENFMKLQDYTAKRFNKYPSGLGWPNLILEYCNGDQAKAFEFFFLILEDFKKEIT